MEKVLLNVTGMSCTHCEKAIKTAAGALDGVTGVEVDLMNKTVTVEFDKSKVSLEDIVKEIEDQGYEVVA